MIGYGIAFYPFIKTTFFYTLTLEDKILVWILVSLLIGIILNFLDLYIYKFFEGLRFWPSRLKKYFYNKQVENLKKNYANLDIIYEQIDEKELLLDRLDIAAKDKLKEELREMHEKASGLWAERRKYPYDTNNRMRSPESPTDFGNALAEYEQYSERQYGMHMMVFWQHLWFILSKEVKDDLELRSAKADFSVYISFFLLTYIFIGTIGFLIYWSPVIAIISFILSILFYHFSYKIAISEHQAYGRYIKAIFDLYRFDLAKKLHIVLRLVSTDLSG